MDQHDEPTHSFELASQNLIDQLCDEFEASWQRGDQPNISAFLARSDSNLWPDLFVELVRLDIAYRSTLGESPTVEEYEYRFPQFKRVLVGLRSPVSQTSIQQLADIREIGGFKLIQKIGAGTFGTVWKAWDPQLEHEVAVKLPTEKSLSREYAAEFRREARAAAKLHHPGIVRVIHYGIDNGIAYIVYDLIKGVTLQQWMKRTSVSPRIAAELCCQVATALSHAHANGVTHRDLKPGNLLIDQAGRLHITDFGLAKRDDSASTAAGTGVILGTLSYMSPEQADGKSNEANARSDIYSLGVILYELLVGKPVFVGEPREVIQKILFADPPPVSTLKQGIHPDLETICHKCLQKQQSDRYATAAELAADLNHFIAGEPILARPVPRQIQILRWLKKHWRSHVPGLALVTLFILFFTRSDQRQTPQQPEPGKQQIGEALPPKTWKIHVTTEPEGASVAIVPCDSNTGEPLPFHLTRIEGRTPTLLELKGGRYLAWFSLPGPDGLRTHVAHRTVPGENGEWPSLSAAWERYQVLSPTEIRWPTIMIPGTDITADMAYIEGTDEFIVNGSGGPKKVSIAPFYVATREFTYGDFLRLRSGATGDVPGKPAPEQPEGNTMPARYDMAEHWAEEAGGRLLTDLEFAYLAKLASEAQKSRKQMLQPDERFDVAGGSDLDEIPTVPPVRGILTGYAEWTSTWPTSPLVTTHPDTDTTSLGPPERQRIIRGGIIECGPNDYPRDPDTTCVATIYTLYPSIGFRLARTPEPIDPSTESE